MRDASSDSLRIETPENVAFEYTLAGIGSRFLAAAVDTLIILALLFLVNSVLLLAMGLLTTDQPSELAASLVIAVLGLASFGIFWGYYIFFEILWNGQSPGKRWQHLRVIRRDGTPAGATEIVIRNLLRLIDFIPANYALGVITMFIDSQSRRLGDLAAGTLVVRDQDDSAWASSLAGPRLPGEVPADSPVLGWPLQRLSPEDLEPVESYLRRRPELHNRTVLSRRLLTSLLDRMGQPPDRAAELDADQALEHLLLAWRQRRAGH